jgi:hypothetical protein
MSRPVLAPVASKDSVASMEGGDSPAAIVPANGDQADAGVEEDKRFQLAEKELAAFDSAPRDSTGSTESKALETLPVIFAPITFGEIALWYSGVQSDFAARSSGYAEVSEIQVHLLLSIANRDANIRARYRIYRDAMRKYDTE